LNDRFYEDSLVKRVKRFVLECEWPGFHGGTCV
jgi:hypothetical protein